MLAKLLSLVVDETNFYLLSVKQAGLRHSNFVFYPANADKSNRRRLLKPTAEFLKAFPEDRVLFFI